MPRERPYIKNRGRRSYYKQNWQEAAPSVQVSIQLKKGRIYRQVFHRGSGKCFSFHIYTTPLIFRIAVIMDALVGISNSHIIFIATVMFAPSYSDVTTCIGLLAMLLQKCIIMGCFMCARKILRLL